jgi:hypothetical protein
MLHQLCAVAQSQNRNSQLEQFSGVGRRTLLIAAVWATGQNDTLRVHGLDLIQIGAIRIYLAVNIAFTDTAGYQLVILAAKVNDNDFLLIHAFPPYRIYMEETAPGIFLLHHKTARRSPFLSSYSIIENFTL